MIKVLHFYKTYYPDSYGGVEQVIFQLCEGTASHNISSTVHYISKHDSNDVEVFHHHHVIKSKKIFEIASTPFSISAIKKFKEMANDADIIHYHFPYPFMDMLHFLDKIDKPSVVSYHSDILKQKNLLKLYKPLMYKFLDSVTAIVATSPNYTKTSDVLKKYINKVSVIPIGLDPNSYPACSTEVSEKWKKRFPQPFFLFVGALRYYKGLYILLDAMVGSDIPIVILGSGPLEKELQAKAASLKLKNIFFLGAQPNEDKVVLLTLCYGVIFPSHLRSEAFGITLLEGAMYSKPLISSEIGTGTTFINIHNETGIVVPPSEPDKLRSAIEYLWNNPDIAARFGAAARERFVSLFTADRMVSGYVNLYEKIVNANDTHQ
ncbi:glycosyltransferase family 4 protein [Pectobacteriaceae bacterium CE90]|nr:glycosyltransferase family 4 protein [Pectobacteriaceae bacterium CE90]